ncbi:MAG TPA: hypothetical protein VEU51_08195 [Candidatus Acidoferrales bacterium]|nr:hypothetical protein [Candidatus Acidoferrales bacterium]
MKALPIRQVQKMLRISLGRQLSIMRILLKVELVLTAMLFLGCADSPRVGCVGTAGTLSDNREVAARSPAAERSFIHETASPPDASAANGPDIVSGPTMSPGNFDWPAISNLQGNNAPQSPAFVLAAALDPLSVSVCPRVISISRH